MTIIGIKVLLCIFTMTLACSLLPNKDHKPIKTAQTKIGVQAVETQEVKIPPKSKAVPQTKRKSVVNKRKPRSRGNLPSRGFSGNSFIVETTAYCKCAKCCGKSNGVTATGRQARYGVIAVDPRVIGLGTRVYVEGYGSAIAADIGGAIKGDKIDLCFNSHKEALKWGRRKVKIMIY